MAKSPSSARYLDSMFEKVRHHARPTESSRIMKERRQRQAERAEGTHSRQVPRLESRKAESAGHYHWRMLHKNLSKPAYKSGEVTKVASGYR